MIRRWWPWVGAAIALAIAACIDTSAPKSGVLSISSLLLPSPSVVVGDVMRDSAGIATPLRVIAYSVTGEPVSGLTPQFFVLDRGGHVDSTGMFFGDSVATVRVVGSVGGLQTGATPIPVTVKPDTVAPSGTIDTLRARVSADTTQNQSSALGVRLTGTQKPAAGFVVRFRILYMPASLAGLPPTVYIGDASGRAMTTDTTDANGITSHRRAIVRVSALGAPLDSIVVQASVLYKGVAVSGSPVRLFIPAKLLAQ